MISMGKNLSNLRETHNKIIRELAPVNEVGTLLTVKHFLMKAGPLSQILLLLLLAVFGNGCSATASETPGRIVPTEQINKFVTPKQASELIQKNKGNTNFVVIDDREPTAYKSGHITNAINVPYGTDFSSRIGQLDKNKVYLVYCPTGCGKTSKIMKELGFKEVYEIQGGLRAWISQGLPVE